MNVAIVLNGYHLMKYSGALPADLQRIGQEMGHRTQVAVSRSLEHYLQLVRRAVEIGAEIVLIGGGDGTLHHALNSADTKKVILSPLPMGTVNAFLRTMGVSLLDPRLALRQLLSGDAVEGWCGLVNGRRFGCFASLGFDARTVHRNPGWLKAVLRGGSFGVTGLRELVQCAAASSPGELRFDGSQDGLPADSVVISKIQNYAGVPSFGVGFDQPKLEAIYTTQDNWPLILSMVTYLALRGPAKKSRPGKGLSHMEQFQEVLWRSPRPTWVQLDGEPIVFDDTRALDIRIDSVPQRYLRPSLS